MYEIDEHEARVARKRRNLRWIRRGAFLAALAVVWFLAAQDTLDGNKDWLGAGIITFVIILGLIFVESGDTEP